MQVTALRHAVIRVTKHGFALEAPACVLFTTSPGREERTPRIEPRWLVPRMTSPEAPTDDHIAGHLERPGAERESNASTKILQRRFDGAGPLR